MNKIKFVVMLLAFGFMTIAFTNCDGDEEPIESCAQDEICTGKNVTSCCTPVACVYKFNGKEYAESEIDQLADDLGCPAGSGARVATGAEREQLKNHLKSLLQEARENL